MQKLKTRCHCIEHDVVCKFGTVSKIVKKSGGTFSFLLDLARKQSILNHAGSWRISLISKVNLGHQKALTAKSPVEIVDTKMW